MGHIIAVQAPLHASLGKARLPGGGIRTVCFHPRSLATVGVQCEWGVGVPPPCRPTACGGKMHVHVASKL